MTSFFIQRLSQTIFVVLASALVSFVLFRYVGDPINNMVGQAASMADREAMRRSLGLEDPVIFQFFRFLRDALSGDLGVSYRFGVPVGRLLMERLPATLELSLCAMLVAKYPATARITMARQATTKARIQLPSPGATDPTAWAVD